MGNLKRQICEDRITVLKLMLHEYGVNVGAQFSFIETGFICHDATQSCICLSMFWSNV